MEAETWKARFRERVISADDTCDLVPELLASLQSKIASPVPTGDADAARAWILATQDRLDHASIHLAAAMAHMGTARELALRGGALTPVAPLASIDHLGKEELAERNALTKLRDAREHAESAYHYVEWCRSHILAASELLDHSGLPAVDGIIQAERLAAVGNLANAKNLADQALALTNGAREDVSRRQLTGPSVP